MPHQKFPRKNGSTRPLVRRTRYLAGINRLLQSYGAMSARKPPVGNHARCHLYYAGKYLLLNVKGCGASFSLKVRDDMSFAELSERLTAASNIPMDGNYFVVNGQRIAATAGRLLRDCCTVEKRKRPAILLLIESQPLSV